MIKVTGEGHFIYYIIAILNLKKHIFYQSEKYVLFFSALIGGGGYPCHTLKEVKAATYFSVWFGKGKVGVCHAKYLLQKLIWKCGQIIAKQESHGKPL